MLLKGHIETTSFPKIFDLQLTIGLDMAGKHCLLDQPIPLPTQNPHMWGRHLPTSICILSSIERRQAAMPSVKPYSYTVQKETNK